MARSSTSSEEEDSPTRIQKASISMADPYKNPLFLHSADNSGVTLVTDKLTGEQNYTTWKRSIMMSLNAKNKLGFIDGSLPKPSPRDPDVDTWSRCNDTVITWIVNAVSKEIGASIVHMKTASAIWKNLNDRFRQSNMPRIFGIERALEVLEQGSLDLNSYYTKLVTLWEELKSFDEPITCSCGKCECGTDIKFLRKEEQRYVLKFLMGLNDTYTPVRRQILLMEPLPTVSRAFNMVIQDQQQSAVPITDAVVFQTTAGYNAQTQYKSRGNSFQNAGNQNRSRPVCVHCGMTGHTITKCYKLHGYPPGYKSNVGRGKGQQTQNSGGNMILQNSDSRVSQNNSDVLDGGNINTENAQNMLSKEQIKQIISHLSTQLHDHGSTSTGMQNAASFTSNFQPNIGPYSGLDDWNG